MAIIKHPELITTYNQRSEIEDIIFPVAKANKVIKEGVCYFDYTELIGTAFFIGNNGFALTCGHVINQLRKNFDPPNQALVARFSDNEKYHHFEIIALEKHPEADVGLIRINGSGWETQVTLCRETQIPSCEYQSWGYPREIARERVDLQLESKENPELIFNQGYVRRIMNKEIIVTRLVEGRYFYELSEIGGQGCSGAPIIIKEFVKMYNRLSVFGIYIAENLNFGYAVRLDKYLDWIPDILGKTIYEESIAHLRKNNIINDSI